MATGTIMMSQMFWHHHSGKFRWADADFLRDKCHLLLFWRTVSLLTKWKFYAYKCGIKAKRHRQSVLFVQLTHHSIRIWGLNPSTLGLGIFVPHREPCDELIAGYRPPMSFCYITHWHLENFMEFWMCHVHMHFSDRYFEFCLKNCPHCTPVISTKVDLFS